MGQRRHSIPGASSISTDRVGAECKHGPDWLQAAPTGAAACVFIRAALYQQLAAGCMLPGAEDMKIVAWQAHVVAEPHLARITSRSSTTTF